MKVLPVKTQPNLTKITGYTALGCGVGSILCATTKNFKSHKILGIASVISALAHIATLKKQKNKYKYLA